MPFSFSDVQLAFEFVSSGGMGENEAYLDRQLGKIYWHSEFGDNDEELPDDIDDEKYISIPDKRELDLGKPKAEVRIQLPPEVSPQTCMGVFMSSSVFGLC